jgi:hypothetical protein
MEDLAPRIVLACILILMPTVATFGQQTSNQYRNRGNAKRKKGDLDGAIADFNQAIKLGVTTYYAE